MGSPGPSSPPSSSKTSRASSAGTRRPGSASASPSTGKEADFVRLGVHNVPLVETPSGHLGISLLDFGDLDGLSKFLAPKYDAYFVDACSEPEVLAAVPASDSDSDAMDDPAAIDWDLDPAITGVAPGDGDG